MDANSDSQLPAKTGKRPKRPNPMTLLLQIQDVLKNEIDSPSKESLAVSSCARMWVEVERLKRDMRMQPKPKPLDVSEEAKAKAARLALKSIGPAESFDPSKDGGS